jgi:hypothetical protein
METESPIDFAAMERAYRRASEGAAKPDAIYIVADSPEEAQQTAEDLMRFVEEYGERKSTKDSSGM